MGTTSIRYMSSRAFKRWLREKRTELQLHISDLYRFDKHNDFDAAVIEKQISTTRMTNVCGDRALYPFEEGNHFFITADIRHAGVHTLAFLYNAVRVYCGDDLLHLHAYMNPTEVVHDFLTPEQLDTHYTFLKPTVTKETVDTLPVSEVKIVVPMEEDPTEEELQLVASFLSEPHFDLPQLPGQQDAAMDTDLI
ncbi:Hypothetical protein POVN_LOCUS721 [uncultured virus]|nr:Hypothetical protein POVN_LOCUS721 [uncultured virus]